MAHATTHNGNYALRACSHQLGAALGEHLCRGDEDNAEKVECKEALVVDARKVIVPAYSKMCHDIAAKMTGTDAQKLTQENDCIEWVPTARLSSRDLLRAACLCTTHCRLPTAPCDNLTLVSAVL